jgi:hypothetical protein
MRVELIHWPTDLARRDHLAAAGQPRLLLVAPDALPPAVIDATEDWVRLPSDEREVALRIQHLLRMATTRADVRV